MTLGNRGGRLGLLLQSSRGRACVLDVLADVIHAQRLLLFTSIFRLGDEFVVPFQVDGKQRFVNHSKDLNHFKET